MAATALLAICSAPLFVTVLAWLLLAERPAGPGLLALALGVAGGSLLVAGSGRPDSAFAADAALALGAGFAYSLYVIVSKRALSRSDPSALAAMTFTAAAVMLAPVLALQGSGAAALWRGAWPLVLYLGAVPTAVAYWLYTSGLRDLRAPAATIVGLLEPFTATVLGLSLFSERLAPAGWLGAALLLAAVILLTAFAAGGVSIDG